MLDHHIRSDFNEFSKNRRGITKSIQGAKLCACESSICLLWASVSASRKMRPICVIWAFHVILSPEKNGTLPYLQGKIESNKSCRKKQKPCLLRGCKWRWKRNMTPEEPIRKGFPLKLHYLYKFHPLSYRHSLRLQPSPTSLPAICANGIKARSVWWYEFYTACNNS